MSTFEFQPVTDEIKASIIATIRKNAAKIQRAGWPGLPEGWIAVTHAHNVDALISDGTLRRHEIAKPGKADPGKTVPYTYLSLEI